jgi:TetR/AcrR family transcriptional regulator, transcriptional repressor for nem operon
MPNTRAQLLRNATETVRRSGSAALNFRDLGQSVGVKSATVHYYFPTKADLLKAIASDYRTEFIGALNDRVRSSRSFRQDLLTLVDLFSAAEDEQLSCLCGMLATEADRLDPQVRAVINEFFAALQLWVVEQARRHEVSAPGGLGRDTFARMLVSLLEGALLLSRLQAHKSSLAAARQWIQKAV